MKERTRVKQERRFTDEQIAMANSVSIIDYANSHGYPIKQVTTNSFKIPGFGGLYIHSGGLKWNRFSSDVGGGTIQFVMHMENKSWVEAMKELLNMPAQSYSYSPSVPGKTGYKTSEKKSFQLPEKNDTFKHIFAYLIKTRKLDKQVVYDLVKQNKIYENKYYNSCVFVGYDNNGEAKYATLRGTSSAMQYRRDVAGSDKSYPFSASVKDGHVCVDNEFSSSSLYVFESPIDLMSYLSLLKLNGKNVFNAHCISLGGVCDLALERYLSEHPGITEIALGLDNDETGRFACEQIRQKYSVRYHIRRILPQNKDFNDDLVKLSISMIEQGKSEPEEQGTLSIDPDESELLLSQ